MGREAEEEGVRGSESGSVGRRRFFEPQIALISRISLIWDWA